MTSPEQPSVLVLVSPELVAMLSEDWSEPVQIKIRPAAPNSFIHGATHEMEARMITREFLTDQLPNGGS